MAPSHYLNWCWIIVYRTSGNKLRWIFSDNTIIFSEENSLENITSIMKWRLFCSYPHCFNSFWPCNSVWQHRSVNIGSGNGLLPDSTKPLPEPVLTCHQWDLVASPEGNFKVNALDISPLIFIHLKMNTWILQLYQTRASELIPCLV